MKKSPLEKFLVAAKLPMLAISGWLLWRRYQRDQAEEEATRLAIEAKRQALLTEPHGATQPLATPAITPTTVQSPQVIYAPTPQPVEIPQVQDLIDQASQFIRAEAS